MSEPISNDDLLLTNDDFPKSSSDRGDSFPLSAFSFCGLPILTFVVPHFPFTEYYKGKLVSLQNQLDSLASAKAQLLFAQQQKGFAVRFDFAILITAFLSVLVDKDKESLERRVYQSRLLDVEKRIDKADVRVQLSLFLLLWVFFVVS
jgi:hypothetical protein